MVAPAATPITPSPLSIAPIIPAQCVPWPLSSSALSSPLTKSQSLDVSTIKSGWFISVPVSIIQAVFPVPSAPPLTLAIPQGVTWDEAEISELILTERGWIKETIWSYSIYLTAGSFSSFFNCPGGILTENPFKAVPYACPIWPSTIPVRVNTFAAAFWAAAFLFS